MSTDLYGIRVLKTASQEKKVTIRVFVVYYDVAYKSHQPIPEDYSFFLRILWSKGDTRFGKGGPIGDEISVDQILDEEWVDKNTYRFVDKVEQLSIKNFPVTDFSKYQDFYYERNGSWEDEDKLVQADYNVYVTDAKYMEHLTEGMSWGTTSYETNAFKMMMKYASCLPNVNEILNKLVPFEGKQEAGTPDKLLFTPDNSKLLVFSQSDEVVAYETGSWKELWRNTGGGMLSDVNIDKDKGIVWQTNDEYVEKAVDYNTGQKSDLQATTTARLMSPLGNYFVNFGDDEYLDFIDNKGNSIWKIKQEGTVEAAAFNKDESLVAIAGMYNNISIWNTKEQTEKLTIETGKRVNRLFFDPTGEFLLATHSNGLIIYDINTKEMVLKYTLTGDNYLGSANWSPDGKYFAMVTIYGPYGYNGHVAIHKVGV